MKRRENDIALQSNFTVGYPVRKTIPRAIMGEVPRARNTAQNTLTTWHADRLYGTILIMRMRRKRLLTMLVQYSSTKCRGEQ